MSRPPYYTSREVNQLDPLPARRVEKMQKFRKWGLSGI